MIANEVDLIMAAGFLACCHFFSSDAEIPVIFILLN